MSRSLVWSRIRTDALVSPDGNGDCDFELPPGDPKDDEADAEQEEACGSCNVIADDTYSGSSSSRILCSSRVMFSRSSCVLVLPFPSSYSQMSPFLAWVHCWQAGLEPSHLYGQRINYLWQKKNPRLLNYHLAFSALKNE